MTTTIELPEESAAKIHQLANNLRLSEEQVIEALVEFCVSKRDPGSMEVGGADHEAYHALFLLVAKRLDARQREVVRSTAEVLGGEARIRDTRIPVWLVVAHKKWGESDSEILAQYAGLNAADLTAAWDFYASSSERVDAERKANEDAD